MECWVDQALKAVARHVGVNKWAILTRGRDADIVRARRLFVAILRQHLGLSLPEIAYMMGRDHSGVLYSTKQVEAREGEEVEADTIAKRLPSSVLARAEMDQVRFNRWRDNHLRLLDRRPAKKLQTLPWLCCVKCKSKRVRPLRNRPGLFCVECNHEFIPETA
jgi:hypothetical protein